MALLLWACILTMRMDQMVLCAWIPACHAHARRCFLRHQKLAERYDGTGKLQYLMQCYPSKVGGTHLTVPSRAGVLETLSSTSIAQGCLSMFDTTWKDSWEPAETVHQQPETTHLFSTYMQSLALA